MNLDTLFAMPRLGRAARARLLAALALAAAAGGAQAAIPAAERQALLALYDATQGAQWTERTGWRGATGSECSWAGVRCDAAGRHVVALHLPNNQLRGRLPRLDALRQLRELRLSLNHLHGPLPPLQGLARLQLLKANNNRLSGPLPALAGLTQLERIDLANNRLHGALPDWQRLPALREVDLSNNRLQLGAPPAPDTLARLRRLDLDFNTPARPAAAAVAAHAPGARAEAGS